MMFPVGKFIICVLLFFGASALSGKNENGTNFVESEQKLGHGQPSVTGKDQLKSEVEKPMDQHKGNEKRNEENELEEQLWTNEEKYEKELEEELPIKVQEARGEEFRYKPPANRETGNVRAVRLELQDKLFSNFVKGQRKKYRALWSVKQQNIQKKELKDQPSIKIDERRKEELQTPIQIQVGENYETDPEGSLPLMWTKMQTRQTSSRPGPILGFKKGSIRFPRSVSTCFSKSSSYLSKKFSRKRKQDTPDLKKRFPSEETVIEAPKPVVSQIPSPQPKPPGVWLRTPQPYVPPRKDFTPFSLADNIEEIVMTPGSGEFVYDTIIQKKTPTVRNADNEIVSNGPAQPINENNNKDMSDAMLSLDQLQEDLPNVKWVSVVVNWFADNINIDYCQIYPAVEFHDGFNVKPEDWYVEYTSRHNARLISRDSAGNPRYGGTVSDGSLKRNISELHRRGYKVMMYPMLVLDTRNKEWRGRLTGPSNAIGRFFVNEYNPFINHYARIAKETAVEAFIIGSEFVGVTKIQDKQGNYPAVSQLVGLAKEVKTSLGGDVIVTYAADWTEYHISSNGRYPLDELWSSEYIDVVGINAYFPLTDESESDGGYTVDDVMLGWITGEGYYYYYDYSKKSPEMKIYHGGKDSKWAWKNIEKWWSEHHFNPDGSATEWRPKSKKKSGSLSLDFQASMPALTNHTFSLTADAQKGTTHVIRLKQSASSPKGLLLKER